MPLRRNAARKDLDQWFRPRTTRSSGCSLADIPALRENIMNEPNVSVMQAAARPTLDQQATSAGASHAALQDRANFFGWLGRALPTFAVLLLLGGFAVVGHYTGWRVPKFSSLLGKSTTQKDDWCKEHSV